MKQLIATALVILLWSEANADEIDRLEQLKESYDREIRRVTEPVKRKYLDALESLQTTYTQAGNLEKALAVKSEIESLTQASASEIATDTQPESFANTRWMNENGSAFWEIYPDGTGKTGISQGARPRVFKWSANASGEIVVEDARPGVITMKRRDTATFTDTGGANNGNSIELLRDKNFKPEPNR